ncbi:MAG: T9SS type A sorting domain-containing protein, partial [Bacteroidetes bacterium]|nr:T9SS type A sorting domain-containing protein [Bacteroidota bacterium]
ADVASATSANNISYYKSTATDLKYWGGNLTIGGIAATITYTAPAVYASYPMGLNTTQSAVTGGSLNVLGNNGTFTGNSTVIADGTGTLTTAAGTFANAMRVVTSQTINFTAPFATGVVTQVNYDYYNAGTKAPMFTISTSSLTSNIGAPSQQTVVTRYKPSTVGIATNNGENFELAVYPNPSSNVINFTTENKNAVSVSICDINGKAINSYSFLNGSLKLDVSNYATGIYSYRVTGNNNQVLKSGKISVNH